MSHILLRMSPTDRDVTIDWITREYHFDRNTVTSWVDHLHFNWALSVKAINEKGDIIGLLNMSDYRIEEESESIISEKPELLAKLNRMRYTAVFSFIVSEPYRHTPLNHEMMMSIEGDLQKYDFLFVPVMHHLKTHLYWKRRGAVEFFRDKMSVYYIIPISETAKGVISD